jgi:hypothetical protein
MNSSHHGHDATPRTVRGDLLELEFLDAAISISKSSLARTVDLAEPRFYDEGCLLLTPRARGSASTSSAVVVFSALAL